MAQPNHYYYFGKKRERKGGGGKAKERQREGATCEIYRSSLSGLSYILNAHLNIRYLSQKCNLKNRVDSDRIISQPLKPSGGTCWGIGYSQSQSITYYLLFTKGKDSFSVEENDAQPNKQISSIMEQTDITAVPLTCRTYVLRPLSGCLKMHIAPNPL